MARIITKELAKKIIKKLKGRKTGSGGAHDEYVIIHDRQIIAVTTIRHGSEKDLGHDHMPGDLHVGPNFAKLIGQCPKSRNDYIRQLEENGTIESSDERGGENG